MFSLKPLAGRFHFVTSCIHSTYEDMRALIEREQPIARRTFQLAIGPAAWRVIQQALGYDRYIPIRRDCHVGYRKSLYRGVPAVFLIHSGIEHIFTLDGAVGPSLARSRRSSRDPGGGEGGGSGRSRASRAASRGQGEDLEVDYSERAGFLTGKAAAIADWQRKKEATEYDALFKRLYARNWQRLYREQHPEEAREKLRAWRAANPERAREANVRQKRTKRERQLQEMKAEYRVIEGVPRRIYKITCAVCGASAEKLQPNAVWCSKVCANRYHSAPRARARNRGIRNMTIIPTALAHIEITPGLTLKELHARMPDASYGSLATTLTALAKREMVQRVDRPDARGQGYVLGPRAPGRSR